ncbi:hypothetical protein [Leptothoe spongobia]|uniref:Uncharacterized protein n=1 Tax=Leptothoe spongobia TAU-MAC 1115 TaxID=1967444 RepID=A0A947DLF5_9CYAN|nr:hypothetical protein [Leptothoe spongobia]MBT9317909.1 hypothetical protein [Leptothoe spongobia TAU-MAC 1115]
MKSVDLNNIDQILGVAVFDPMGLPRDYFITPQHKDTEWVQLVFQSLGLQQLIASTMALPVVGHTMIRTKIGNIVIVCCESGYIAVLLKRALPQERPQIDSDWVAWLCDFEAMVVRTHANFKAV